MRDPDFSSRRMDVLPDVGISVGDGAQSVWLWRLLGHVAGLFVVQKVCGRSAQSGGLREGRMLSGFAV